MKTCFSQRECITPTLLRQLAITEPPPSDKVARLQSEIFRSLFWPLKRPPVSKVATSGERVKSLRRLPSCQATEPLSFSDEPLSH